MLLAYALTFLFKVYSYNLQQLKKHLIVETLTDGPTGPGGPGKPAEPYTKKTHSKE